MKKQIISLVLISAIAFCGCTGAGGSGGSEQTYSYTLAKSTSESEASPEIEYNYNCAADLVGEGLADINASNFDYDLIFSLNEYNVETAKPYTILVDGSYAFAAAVICKGSAVISDGVKTSVSMVELDPNFDYSAELGYSAAFESHYAKRMVTASDGERLNLRYMWKIPNKENYFKADGDAKSICAIIYKDSYVYMPEYDFMWFTWDNSIYEVENDLISRGFEIESSPYFSNRYVTESVSEQLYGQDFNIYLDYNANGQFVAGTYSIGAPYAELADIFEAALKDLIAKYGDTDDLFMTEKYRSLDEMLRILRTYDKIDMYLFNAQLKWNVQNHTEITLSLYSTIVEIEYKNIANTSGTGSKEDSLI